MDWPGQPVQKNQWPGTPAKGAWPGQPVPLHDRPPILMQPAPQVAASQSLGVADSAGRPSQNGLKTTNTPSTAISGKIEEIPLGDLQLPGVSEGKPQSAPPKTPSAFGSYVDTSISQLASIPKDILNLFKESTGEEFKSASGLTARGVANMKAGNPFGIVQDIAGTAQQVLSPLSGAIDTAGEVVNRTVDPGFVAGEAHAPPKAPETKPPALEATPRAVGAAATPTADVLAGAIADREKAAAKTPGFVDSIKSAAQTINKAFNTGGTDAAGKRAATSIRTQVGRGVRDSEKTADAVRQFQKLVNTYTPQEKLDVIDWIQDPSRARGAAYEPSEEAKPLINTLKGVFADRRAKLEAAPSTAQMSFIEDYYPQLWKDPAKAQAFAQSFGTKEGSSGFTKARIIPTVADGIRAGLEPITIDPIEGTLRYVENVDRFLATNAVFDDAIERGDVLWRARGKQPDGWVEVQGRKNAPETGQRPYAPEGWARVYNNFISRRPEGAWGDILQGVQRASNAATQFKLALSAYHATNIAGESIVGGVANAIDELAGGHPIRALAALGSAPLKPVTSALRGKQLVKAYLHDLGSPEMRKVAELAANANFRVVGKGRVADEYRFSGAGSLYDAYKRGSLRADLASTYRSASPMVGALKVIGRTISGTLESISDPLFKTYIPLVKNGAYFDMLSTWLKAHPEATAEEQVAFAQRASDMIDNRFGEMNHDNIFWSKTQKMLSQAAFLSYSYQLGTVREAGGALRDVAKAPFTREWTPKMSWAVALPITVGTLGAMVQYLHTGKAPESMRDLFAPQTGGIDPTTGQPEREIIPSYASQFMGAAEHPLQEVGNKINPMWQFLGQLAAGKDWRGDPIAYHDWQNDPYKTSFGSIAGYNVDPAATAVKRYLEFVGEALGPIQLENRQKLGSHISLGEMLLGARNAPQYLTAPELTKEQKKKYGDEPEDRRKARHEAKDRRIYGGTQ